jgi:hypothetical protein
LRAVCGASRPDDGRPAGATGVPPPAGSGQPPDWLEPVVRAGRPRGSSAVAARRGEYKSPAGIYAGASQTPAAPTGGGRLTRPATAHSRRRPRSPIIKSRRATLCCFSCGAAPARPGRLERAEIGLSGPAGRPFWSAGRLRCHDDEQQPWPARRWRPLAGRGAALINAPRRPEWGRSRRSHAVRRPLITRTDCATGLRRRAAWLIAGRRPDLLPLDGSSQPTAPNTIPSEPGRAGPGWAES